MLKTDHSLHPDKIAAHCASHAQPLTIEVVAQTASTNSDLLIRTATLTNPTVLVAETQTAGRGRAGRSWISAPCASLTFSLAWPFAEISPTLLGLPLVAGIALADALREAGVIVQLKWPNDVQKEGKKLAGILIETNNQPQWGLSQSYPKEVVSAEGLAGTTLRKSGHTNTTWAIIGVGLNLRISQQLEQQISQPVADATWLAQMDRNQLLAILINHLIACLEQFTRSGFAPFMSTWNTLHAYGGQSVRILDQGQTIREGTALGVDQSGCLLLRDKHGVIWPIMAGDVSLRPIE